MNDDLEPGFNGAESGVPDPSSPRAQLAAGLASYMTANQIRRLLDETLALTKEAWADFSCKGCGKRQKQAVQISDARSVTSGIGELLTQGFGRPSGEPAEREVIVNRTVELFVDCECTCMNCAARSGGSDNEEELGT